MHKVTGGCHCGNILVSLELTNAPETCHPRACDCDFCRKHGAAYISDARGSLLIAIRDPREYRAYRQGSGQAEFIVCATCGVLIGVLHRDDGRLHGAVNVKALESAAQFAAEQVVSPKQLAPEKKVQRWRDVWFSDVQIRVGSPP